MEAARELAQLGERQGELLARGRDEVLARLVAGDAVLQEPELERDPDETLLGAVVEVALQPPALGVAGRAGLPVALDVDVAERLPRPVEAAAYYIVAEALTNASKHAAACEARVELTRAEGVVLVSVADDGIGGADVRGGSGVRGLADRVDALGGTLAFESPPGGGTRVSARIPCAG